MSKLILLGTKGGPRVETNSPRHTSHLLEVGNRYYIIDCGLGVIRAIVQKGYKLCDLHTIFITHHHCDHTLELGALVYTAWNSNLLGNVKIYGPPETKNYFHSFFQAMNFDLQLRITDEGAKDIRKMTTIKEYQEGIVMQDDLVKVSALKNIHPPIVETYALKFEFANKIVVFGGDTAFCKPLITFAKGADVLIHEVMLEEGIELLAKKVIATKPMIKQHLLASHTLAADVGSIANQAGVKHLVVNHLLPTLGGVITKEKFIAEIRKNWKEKLSIGQDGLVIEIA